MRHVLHQLAAIARRDLIVQLSYGMRLVMGVLSPFAAAFLAFYVSQLVGDPRVLQQYGGGYFEYALVGLALTAYASLGVSAFTGRIVQEQGAGTLEVLLAGPTRLSVLLSGGLVVPLLVTTVQVGLLLGIGVGVLGVGLSWSGFLTALPVLALTVANFCVIGIVAAAVTLLVKRGDPFSGLVYQLTLVLSGALFPIDLLPSALQWVSRATPAYYGVRGLRQALLTSDGLPGVIDELTILFAFAAVSLPVAVLLFARAVNVAKRYGILGSY